MSRFVRKSEKGQGAETGCSNKAYKCYFLRDFLANRAKGKKKSFLPFTPEIFFNLNGSRFLKKVWKLQEWTQASGNAYKQCKSAVLIVYWMVWLQLYIVLADKNLIIQISVLCLNFLSFFPLKKMSYISSCALCC